jgi:group I intron endonuclease
MWKHQESGTIYIGSAMDLSTRLLQYYMPSQLKRVNNYICRAILRHGHSAFSLSIIEYIDILNLGQEDARNLILSREQVYLNLIFSVDEPNTYNILKVAGSPLGYKHSESSKSLISSAHKGRTYSAESIALMSKARQGLIHSAETKAKMSEAHKGKTLSAETIAKMSLAKGGSTIYVYDTQGTLVNTFSSARKAAVHLECSYPTILKFAKNGLLFKDKWVLSTSERSSG